MNVENTYLTDEELERLIADVEEHDLVSAPPELLKEILTKIEACADTKTGMDANGSAGDMTVKKSQAVKENGKKRDFQLYCFRVISSVAAAIMLLFTLPKVSETVLKTSEAVREETVYEPQISLRYETKEEALNDRGILAETFGKSNIFDNDFDWNIFK